MKICVVSQQLKKSISGVGLHTNNLVQSLCSDGHQVSVIVPKEQIPEGNLPYRVIPVKSPLFGSSQARWISLSWNFSQAISKLGTSETFDIIHFTDARESLLYFGKAPAAGNINDTYSAELHSIGYYQSHYKDWLIRWGYYLFVHFFEGIALRKLKAVIANSQYTAQTILENYGVKQDHLHICYKSIYIRKYASAVSLRDHQEPHPPVLLFVGTNMQRKGLPTLIRAAPFVLRHAPQTQIWVVGEDKAVPHMKELCQTEGVLDAFRFMGWKSQQELVDIYTQADIFVMPSLTEALGMVFVEAMAAGVAVIGTSVGGIPEIIQDGVNGLLVPPNDPNALSQALIRVINDPDLRKRLVEESVQTVEMFSVENMMRKTYQIYSEIMSSMIR